MGLRGQSIVGCFPEFVFQLVSPAAGAYGVAKAIMNNFVFSTWACAAGLIRIRIIKHDA